MRIDLARVHLAAKLQPVLANYSRERVAYLEDVLGLYQRRRIHAGCEVVEGEVLDALGRRLQRIDSACGRPAESLRSESGSDAAARLANGVVIAHITQVRLVERRGAKCNSVIQ